MYGVGMVTKHVGMSTEPFVRFPGPQTTVEEQVFMFGHMLYEMASGEPLKVGTIESCPPNIDLNIC